MTMVRQSGDDNNSVVPCQPAEHKVTTVQDIKGNIKSY